MGKETNQLQDLFTARFGESLLEISKLPGSGSYRQYYRLRSSERSVVGVYNEDLRENEAFLSFTGTFVLAGFPVPSVLGTDPGGKCYLLADLGDTTLYGLVSAHRENASDIPAPVTGIYKKVLTWLPRFQIEGGTLIDFGKSYPRQAFDRQSMMWDLSYFKYYFLKLVRVPFDEQLLEDDFGALSSFLLQANGDYFMYRDFQSRNVMIVNGEPCFIDYQGGRKGPLQYDVASLLYDAKADLPEESRAVMLNHYLDTLEAHLPGQRKTFLAYYPGFILIRILQALGAYGFRGYYEKKIHFLQSIPYALGNLKRLRSGWARMPHLPELPSLWKTLERAIGSSVFKDITPRQSGLYVTVGSFSYKTGIPADDSGHGGGFVFDCRSLPNPGRYEAYKDLTGKDEAVIRFLEQEPEVSAFLDHVFGLVDASVNRYITREFTSLTVYFGCTGGRHRSVFFAENLARHLEARFPVKVNVVHQNI